MSNNIRTFDDALAFAVELGGAYIVETRRGYTVSHEFPRLGKHYGLWFAASDGVVGRVH